MDDNYVVKKKLGNLMEDEKGNTKEVNVLTWYGSQPGIDIRRWSPNHKAGRGIFLNMEEAEELKRILDEYLK